MDSSPGLASLAVAFRDPAQRHDYATAHPEFMPWLGRVVERVRETTTQGDGDGDDADAELGELCKLVANFVADDDTNRSLICQHTSFLALVRSRIHARRRPPHGHASLKPLLASLLNLLLSETYLVPHTTLLPCWLPLVRWANELHIPAAEGKDEDEGGCAVEEKATMASWAWQCVHRLLDAAASHDPPREIPSLDAAAADDDDDDLFAITHHLFRPLTHFAEPADAVAPSRGAGTMLPDLTILEACADVVCLLADHPAGGRRVCLGAVQSQQDTTDAHLLVRFIEYAEVVDGWTGEDADADADDDSESEQEAESRVPSPPPPTDARPGENALGRVKARLMALLADLCAEPGIRLFPTDASVRKRGLGGTLVRWIGHDRRDDLVTCGLLCMGNYITDDARAREITSQPHLVAHLTRLLDSTDPSTPPQRTHALLGALRNLALAPSSTGASNVNRQLAPHVVEAVKRAGLIMPGMDLVASVQGGAVGLMRLLCRGDETTSRETLADDALTSATMDLWQRTDDQSLKTEIARWLVVLARSGPPSPLPAADDRVVRAVAGLLGLGGQQEVLLAEGVLALALLAKTPAGARTVYDVLSAADDKALVSLEAYATSPTAPPPVLSNICILLLHLAQARQPDNNNEDDMAGRIRRTLQCVAARQGLDESSKGAVAAAQAAWR
ncbi:hypothetical protein NliqN6_2014 [Naganishia liquefaciens]|uniref:Uncharacterized protein n=1 Tax=Naganishia liquefaciens TaxID=104408 RepID=A0A8H3TR06_9TREE|nr:hypothetical protein NliqN6_2014 [Naganishia liquefaciens]